LKTVTLYIFTLLFGFNLALKANSEKLDSLKQAFKAEVSDSIKIEIANKIVNLSRDINPKTSEKYALLAIDLAIKLNDKKTVSKFSHNLGVYYYLTADYNKALEYYLYALKIREEYNDSANIAKSYNNIALLFYQKAEYQKSLDYHHKSIQLKQKLKDFSGLASSYGNIGNIYFEIGKTNKDDSLFEKAKNYHTLALKIQEEIAKNEPDNGHNLVGLAGTYTNLGNIFFERAFLYKNNKLLIDAIKYQNQALEIKTAINDERGVIHSYINIAGIKDKMGNNSDALKDYYFALNKALQLNYKEELKYCYEGMADAYENAGDLKNALKFYKLFSDIKDTLSNNDKMEHFAEMQVKFDSEKKEQEIELLNKNKILQEIELEKQTQLRNSLLIGLLLVILLVIIIYNRYRIKTQTSNRLSVQNKLIAQKNKEITDSIEYAKNLQLAIMPPAEYINELFSDNFIFYKPKDIVSGDFYWFDTVGDKVYFAAVDCTGHGVPGAFLSIVGYNLLKHAIHEHKKVYPNEILAQLNIDLYQTLKNSYKEKEIMDGMDIALCCFDRSDNMLHFSGANNGIYIISDEFLTEMKADKKPIGTSYNTSADFKNNTIKLQKGDIVYLFTDGISDQFGGENNKKYTYRRLKEKLVLIKNRTLAEQKTALEKDFYSWKGDNEQIDDILLMGIKIK
jgi:serine phosphatase RsbU (regulator of sigma subunit)